MKVYDAVVIGGGPAGMTAALYLLRAGVQTAMIEKLSPGGQVLMTSEIENYPGFPTGLQGWELADKFAAHLEPYPLERVNDEVRSIEFGPDGHVIKVGEEDVRTKAIILATGSRYRKLGIPGEERLLGRGVSYCALCDGNFFRGREVAVVGGQLRPGRGAVSGAHLDRVIARAEDQIGLCEEGQDQPVGLGRQAGRAKRERMILGDQSLGLVGGEDGEAVALGEMADRGARPLVHGIDTRHHHRPLRPGKPAPGAAQLGPFGGAEWRGRRTARPRGHCRGRGNRDRNVDMHRSRPALGRDAHGLVGKNRRRPRDIGETGLGDGAEHLGLVQHLMGIARGLLRVDGAGQHDQRHPVLAGVFDHIDGVQRAGPDRRDQNARRAGCG